MTRRLRGRIKVGATVLHDMRAWTWPQNANKGVTDPDLVFEIKPISEPGGWKCIRDGFGAAPHNGVSGEYRNGSILLHGEENIRFINE